MHRQQLTFTIASGQEVGTTVISFQGPFTLANLASFQDDLHTLQPPVLILNMEHVPYMDSAGLGVLASAHVSAQTGGRHLLIASPAGRVLTLLQLTRLEGVLRCFRSVSEAEAAVSGVAAHQGVAC